MPRPVAGREAGAVLPFRESPVPPRRLRSPASRDRRVVVRRPLASTRPAARCSSSGSGALLIASNSIDDVYDYINGVDQASERMFPKEFPGWKPIPRGLMSVDQGFAISFAFYLLSLVGGRLSRLRGGLDRARDRYPGDPTRATSTSLRLLSSTIGVSALGELSIFFSFGPIPALGAFYVLTRGLALLPLLASIPCGSAHRRSCCSPTT